MGMLDRIHKRKCFPVNLDDRTIHVRALKKSEFQRMGKLDDELKNAYFLGKALVLENGESEIPQQDGEQDKDYAERVDVKLDEMDIDTPTMVKVIHQIGVVTKFDPDDMEKN